VRHTGDSILELQMALSPNRWLRVLKRDSMMEFRCTQQRGRRRFGSKREDLLWGKPYGHPRRRSAQSCTGNSTKCVEARQVPM